MSMSRRRSWFRMLFAALLVVPLLLAPLAGAERPDGRGPVDNEILSPDPSPEIDEVLDQAQSAYNYGFWYEQQVIRWQEFIPTLDNVSSVQLMVDRDGEPGNTVVQLKTQGGALLATKTVPQASVPSYGWLHVTFDSPVSVTPGSIYRIYVFSDESSPSPSQRFFWLGHTESTYNPICQTSVSGSWPGYHFSFKTYGLPSGTGPMVGVVMDWDQWQASDVSDLLQSNGYRTNIIQADALSGLNLSGYDMFVACSNTDDALSVWCSPSGRNALEASGKPILGMGLGGYALFGELDLDVGYGHGWHGSETDMYVVDPMQALYHTPYHITIPANRILDLYTYSYDTTGIYAPTPSADITLIGREVHNDEHYPIIQEGSRYLLWGYDADTEDMTQTGEELFINIVNYLLTDTYRIYGQVLEGFQGVSGATVSCAGRSDMTDSGGHYEISGLPAGTYDVTVEHPNYAVQGSPRQVTVPPDTLADFYATASGPQDTLFVRDATGIIEVAMDGTHRSVLYGYPGGEDFEIYDGKLYIWSPDYACWDLFDTEGQWLGSIYPPSRAITVDGFTCLPGDRIAYYDFLDKVVHIIDDQGHMLHDAPLIQVVDPSRSEMEGVVVGNTLVIFENVYRNLWQIDLDTYERTLLGTLPIDGVPYRGIDYTDGTYYIVGEGGYYISLGIGEEQETQRADRVLEGVSAIAVAGGYGYVTTQGEGSMYRADLSTGDCVLMISGLEAPTDIEALTATMPRPDIRVEPNTLTFDLRDTEVQSDRAANAGLRSSVDVDAVSSGADELVIDILVPKPERADYALLGKTYQQALIDGEGQMGAVGQPALPAVRRFVAVPEGKRAVVTVAKCSETVLSGWHVAPVQPPQPDSGPDAEAPLVMDGTLYATDASYPSGSAELEEPFSVRGTDLVGLCVYPYRYNPVAEELLVATKLQLVVSFVDDTNLVREDGAAHWPVDLQDMVLNADTVDTSRGAALAAETNPGFLIITAPDFQAAATTLANYRATQGLDVEVRTTAATGTTASSIQSYIQNAYDDWMSHLAYVLILGDAEHVPTNYVTEHGGHDDTLLGTDLYYATVDGSDYFPDLAIGRIPVDSATQANDFVDRIIAYEQSPVTDPDFYNHMAVAAYFQDRNDDTYADRRFIKTSEEIRDYLLAQGYDVERIYVTEEDDNPLFYNDGSYGNGEPLPTELLRSSGFAWDGDRFDVENAINQGSFIVNHRDHGGFTGWGDPYFRGSHVADLTNGNRLPLVFSINCQTGWFDNETDASDLNTDYGSVCFAEEWLRNPSGGAVGVFAATRISYSGYNDTLVKGFYDAIWPGFLGYSGAGAALSGTRPRMGDVLNYGKVYLASVYGDWTTRKIEFEEFHYFGDPTTQLWTSQPTSIQQIMTIHNDGDADLVVTAIDKRDGSSWLDTVASLPLTIPPGESRGVAVTIDDTGVTQGSHQDRLLIASNDPDENPYPDGVDVTLILEDAGRVELGTVALTRDMGGNSNGVINPGETIEMLPTLRNVGQGVAYDVVGTFTCSSPWVTMVDGHVSYSAIGAQGPLTGDTDHITFDVDSGVSGRTLVFIQAEFTASNGGPWQDEFGFIIEPNTRPPYTPKYPYPHDGATNRPTRMTLRWEGGDPDGDRVYYSVHLAVSHPYFDPVSSFGTMLHSSPYPYYNTSYLDPGTRYFWYVVAQDVYGASTTGPVWEFVTLGGSATTCRNLLPMVVK